MTTLQQHMTPIMAAVEKGNNSIIDMLIAQGADINDTTVSIVVHWLLVLLRV